MDKNDIFVSSHTEGDEKRILVEYRFKDGETVHKFRFQKEF